jgi:hypothetical protein
MRARGHYVAMYRYSCVLVNYAKCVRAPYIRLHVQELPVRNYSLQTNITERLDRAVNTSASYSGSPGLKSRSRDRLSWCFVVFLRSSRQMDSRPYLKLGHDRILPHHFQFIIQIETKILIDCIRPHPDAHSLCTVYVCCTYFEQSTHNERMIGGRVTSSARMSHFRSFSTDFD